MHADYEKLQQSLNYRFSNPALLKRALTHRSAQKENNERLEFLGDALLGFIVAEILHRQFPEASEGELSRIRSNFVNKRSLVKVARQFELGEFIELGAGERSSGGRERDSILADAVEALIAAIYLDGGLPASQEFIASWNEQPRARTKDSKTVLQELAQSKSMAVPCYRVLEISGAAHQQQFQVECEVALVAAPVRGSGASKRKAEQDAATKVLEQLGLTQ
ncbi:MAG: ribonuclease III [Gammaproteobacteria bacterium]